MLTNFPGNSFQIFISPSKSSLIFYKKLKPFLIFFRTQIFLDSDSFGVFLSSQINFHTMPYLTISGLFVEIWSVCSPKEAHGNEKSYVNACPTCGHLDPEISR